MKRSTKKFHIGDVISITTGLLVSPDHIGGVYNILGYMTGDSLFTHQLPRAGDDCKPYLLKQFPWLATVEFQGIVDKLKFDLSANKNRPSNTAKEIVDKWLKDRVVPKTGEFVAVEPLPSDSKYEHKEPIAELKKMAGKKLVIVVEVPQP